MERDSSMHKAITSFAILMMLFFAGCSQRLKPVNGEFDPCLLVTPAEVEVVSGIQVVASKPRSMSPPDGTIGCKYSPDANGQAVLLIQVSTDATLKKAHQPYSAAESYESVKRGEMQMLKELPEIKKVKDIDNFGDQAYFAEGTFLVINILENEIYYEFVTFNGSSGIGYEALMELVKIALQRMP